MQSHSSITNPRAPDITGIDQPGFSSFLHAVRWLAAMLVVVNHVRQRMFVSLPDTIDPTWITKLFYLVGGFGKESVLIFFVLSGYLVGGLGSIRAQSGNFDLGEYALNRFARLYVVLVPAVILGFALDQGGRLISDPGFYTPEVVDRLGLATLLGNLLMLQSFVVPMVGMNTPLWSLSFEFWFYVAFGVAAWAAQRGRWPALAAFLAAGMLTYLLGLAFAWGLFCWLCGTVAALASPIRSRMAWLPAVALLLMSLAYSRSSHQTPYPIAELCLSASFGLLLWTLKAQPLTLFARTHRLHLGMADFSYTLYAIHHPLLIFLLTCIYRPEGAIPYRLGLQPAGMHLFVYVSIVCTVVCVAYLLSRVTEYKTSEARRWLREQITRLGRSMATKTP